MPSPFWGKAQFFPRIASVPAGHTPGEVKPGGMGMYNKVELCGLNTAQLPVLTEDEKRRLLIQARGGDRKAREQMVEGNLRLVLSVVQRFAQRGENLDE